MIGITLQSLFKNLSLLTSCDQLDIYQVASIVFKAAKKAYRKTKQPAYRIATERRVAEYEMRTEEARRLREVEVRQAEAARAFWSGESQVVSNRRTRIPFRQLYSSPEGSNMLFPHPDNPDNPDVPKRQKKEKPLPKRRIRIKK